MFDLYFLHAKTSSHGLLFKLFDNYQVAAKLISSEINLTEYQGQSIQLLIGFMGVRIEGTRLRQIWQP